MSKRKKPKLHKLVTPPPEIMYRQRIRTCVGWVCYLIGACLFFVFIKKELELLIGIIVYLAAGWLLEKLFAGAGDDQLANKYHIICSCGWSGSHRELKATEHGGVCPSCQKRGQIEWYLREIGSEEE